MDIFDGSELAESVLPRRVFRALAQLASTVLVVAFLVAPERSTAWLMRQSDRHVRHQIEPLIADLTKSLVTTPPTNPPRADGQTSGR